MLPREKVQNLIDRHLKLEKELSAGEFKKKICRNIKRVFRFELTLSKPAKEFLSFEKDIEDLKKIL